MKEASNLWLGDCDRSQTRRSGGECKPVSAEPDASREGWRVVRKTKELTKIVEKSYFCQIVRETRRSRLPASIEIEPLKYFCAGATARSAAELTGVNRNTAILFIMECGWRFNRRPVGDLIKALQK